MSSNEQAFRIGGMDCAEEIAVLKREVGPLVGGEAHLAFDLLNAKMTVRSAVADAASIVAAVERAGMRAEKWRESSSESTSSDRATRAALTASSGALSLAGFLAHVAVQGGAALGSEGAGLTKGSTPLLAKALYLAGIAAGVAHVVPRAALAARRLRPDMNLLMAVAVVGAIALGEWFEAATVSFLFSLSLALEAWSVERARRAVRALMDLAPPTVRIVHEGGREEEVPPASVAVGARFVVRPGERVPLDGSVLGGFSEVNQAPITGESRPVPKRAGDVVFAGTVNGDGALEVECTKLASDTTLAHIVRSVADAQTRRAPSEQWVESFARYYTPAVLAVAMVVLFALPTFGRTWEEGIYRALVLLVIGCPCALVISTPVTIVAALAAAAKNGVLVKGGLHLEVPGQLSALAIDKTGTLTEGKPAVVEIVPLAEHSEDEVLAIAAAIELRSEHPLARAIVAHASRVGTLPSPAGEVQAVQGKGVTARIEGKRFWLGSHRLLEERGQETPEVHDRLSALSAAGRSVVVLGDDHHACGFIALADSIRPGTAKVIRALRAAGIRNVTMLTGDNRGTAEAVGREVGVDTVQAELLPVDKVGAIEAMVAQFGQVGMVGDGVNDAPALARASLGIAMGGAGSDAAIETADVTLMSDDLSHLPWLIGHSRRMLRIVRQNIAFSLGIKGLFVALTFLGYASLWAAIAADMGASLAVIANGLRLLRARVES